MGHCAVGIDADRVARETCVFSDSRVSMPHFCRSRPGIGPKLDALRKLYEGKKIIVGRDKLDVVKGVVQKV